MTVKQKNYSLIATCLITCLIVFVFFMPTLGYPWRHFDENIIFQETILPIPKSFAEIFDFITLFGVNQHFVASNPFYSDISNLRNNPLNCIQLLFVYYLFQKSAFAYHFLSLSLHILNSFLLFNILNTIILSNPQQNKITKYLFPTLLTLLWALHPVNIESVVFATNWTALFCYMLCFLVFYYMTSKSLTKYKVFLSSILYLIAAFTCEHSATLPLILFFYIFSIHQNSNKETSLKDSLSYSSKKTYPLFFVILIIVFYRFSSSVEHISSIKITLERIFWLSPQIFTHFIKLVLFPVNLSIDQTALVQLGKSLFAPYAIFCLIFTTIFLFISITAALNTKKTLGFICFICLVPFFIALLPYLHVISPIYNLASERYLYFPLFFLAIGLLHFFLYLTKARTNHFAVIMLCIILCTFSTRAYLRTFDWKDGLTLVESAVNVAPNSLFKGLRQEMAATYIKSFPTNLTIDSANQYSKEALSSLEKAIKEFSKQNQDNTPEIIKFYGLDPKTQLAKTKFLIAFTKYDLNNDPHEAYEIFSPYIKELRKIDSQILSFYYKVLFSLNKIDEAEDLLHTALKQNKISPTLFVALSDFSEYKYNDLSLTKKYLKKSFSYFPYDSATLFGLKRLYKQQNNAELYAHYSYLFGLRTHDQASLKDAAYVYGRLKKIDKVKKITKHVKNKIAI